MAKIKATEVAVPLDPTLCSVSVSDESEVGKALAALPALDALLGFCSSFLLPLLVFGGGR